MCFIYHFLWLWLDNGDIYDVSTKSLNALPQISFVFKYLFSLFVHCTFYKDNFYFS